MNRDELKAGDFYCRLLATQHYENFTVASRFVPPAVRTDLMRVYAYCRTTDDLGDESGADALARLARWRDEVADVFAGGAPVHPVLVALRETIVHHALPAQPFLDLIAANLQDQHVASYATWAELVAYCMLSAAPVGRMVLAVFGIDDASAVQLSDDVCLGLQLANFAQDVACDAGKGRTYLIQSDLRALGVAGATRALCERARALLQSGLALERMAPFALRVQLSLYRLGGLAICDAIQRAKFRTDVARPRVTRARKLTLACRALAHASFPSGGLRRVEPA